MTATPTSKSSIPADGDHSGGPAAGSTATPPTPTATSNPSPPSHAPNQVDPSETGGPSKSPEPPNSDPPDLPETRSGENNANDDPPNKPQPSHVDPPPSSGVAPSKPPAASDQSQHPPATTIDDPRDPEKTDLKIPTSPHQSIKTPALQIPGPPNNDPGYSHSSEVRYGDPSGASIYSATPPAVYLQGSKISEGAPPITRAGKTIAYKSGSIYVGTSAVLAPQLGEQGTKTIVAAGLTFSVKPSPADRDPMPTLTIGSEILTADAASRYIFGSQTLVVGGPAITASGIVISLSAGASGPEPITRTEEPKLGSLIMNGFGAPTQAPQPSTPSPITLDGLTFSTDASQAIIGDKTYAINGNEPLSTVVYNGRTIYLGAGGVAVAPTLSALTAGGLTLSLDDTEAFIQGTRYPIGQGAKPTTIVVGDETLSLGPNGIQIPSRTITPPAITSSLSALTIDGFTFSLDATEAVIKGTTYSIGPDAASKAITLGTETLNIGPNGIEVPPTTITPLSPTDFLSSLIVDGLTIALDSTEAVIGGTTYSIGKDAPATTVVIGNETISLGPAGIGFPSTTIPPSGNTSTSNPFEAFTGVAGRLRESHKACYVIVFILTMLVLEI